MPHSRPGSRIRRRWSRRASAGLVLAILSSLHPGPTGGIDGDAESHHLIVSEVVTGGAGASDEFIEITNPGPGPLPLEGLEVVYLSATGTAPATRAAWPAGAPSVEPGGHVLIANAAGAFAPIADAVYAAGIAAAGGSVAIRIQGASTPLDAVGWGTAANAWMEGSPAPAPQPGSSIERLPGGELGSTQDTDDNVADFAERTPPDPQNSTSPPAPPPGSSPTPSPSSTPAPSPTPPEDPTPTPMPTPTPTASADASPAPSPTPSTPGPTPTATPAPTPEPTPAPTPSPMPISQARGLPDGSAVTVAGVALTASDFTDGGGYVADDGGGIAVLVTGGAFARGDAVTAAGEIDDRFSQRTLRVAGVDLAVTGSAAEPDALPVTTGGIDEGVEGRLVRVTASVDGAPTPLTGGLAFQLDDGSGAVRVLVLDTTGIDVGGWTDGTTVSTVGVVGQRDTTGAGTRGYRVQPRAPSDVLSVATPSASPSPGAHASGPASSASPSTETVPLVTIAAARAAPQNERLRVRGVVTLASGLVEAGSAVVQDATGAILLRLDDEAGTLERGEQVEASGTRSTKGGMLTLRVGDRPIRLGRVSEPAPASRSTGAVGEDDEARLVAVRGGIVANPRRSSSGTITFDVDDGSGPLRISVAAATGIDDGALAAGAWVAVSGVLGQETTGSQPTSGYRLWPRDGGDLRVLAAPVAGAARLDGGSSPRSASRTSGSGASGSEAAASAKLGGLEPALTAADGATVSVEATLVAGPWPQLGIAAVLWDGIRAVGIADDAAARAIVEPVAASGIPVAVRLSARPPPGSIADLGLPTIGLAGSLQATGGAAQPPATAPPGSGPPTWVRLSGLVSRAATRVLLAAADGIHRLDDRCEPSPLPDSGAALVHGIGVAEPVRLVVACDGVRPASTLTDGTAAVPAERAPRSAITVPTPGAGAEPADRRPLALLLAALTAAGGFGSLLVRRGALPLGREPRASAAGESVPAMGGEDDEVATGPALTLVPLPRERGSP